MCLKIRVPTIHRVSEQMIRFAALAYCTQVTRATHLPNHHPRLGFQHQVVSADASNIGQIQTLRLSHSLVCVLPFVLADRQLKTITVFSPL